jgi:hypothetical protein
MDFQQIVEAFENAGFEPRSYSGKYMYSERCLGISGDSALSIVIETIAEFARNAETTDEIVDFVERLGNVRSDSLGLGQIVYFPSIEWEE